MRAILRQIGLRAGIEMKKMDDLVWSGRLYCACGDPALPLPEKLTWAKLVSAFDEARETFPCRIIGPLDGPRMDALGDVRCSLAVTVSTQRF